MTIAIDKTPNDWRVPPNLTDYAGVRRDFDWSQVPNLCEGMGAGRCNIAYAAVGRHAHGPAATRTALRFVTDVGQDGTIATRDLTYAQLEQLASQFTGVLRALGVAKGDRLFTILGRIPELYIAISPALVDRV